MQPIKDIRVLFVDDDPRILNSLRRFLRKEEYQSYFVVGGAEALEMMRAKDISVIVSDLRMPEMDGLTLLAEVRNEFPETVRMILSATRDVEQTIDSINNGEVFRFIPKPMDPEPFKKIIMDGIEYYRLKTERYSLTERLSSTNAYLENAISKIHRINGEKEKLAEEAQRVERRIEQYLLQSQVPGDIEGATLAAASTSSGHLDGDFFDIIRYGAKAFDLVIADVMGKGLQSALVGAGIKTMILRGLATHDCRLGVQANCPYNPSDITTIGNVFAKVHAMSIEKLLRLNMYATLCYMRFDLARAELAFLDCGHPKTIHYRSDEKDCIFLEGTNLPLGLDEDAEYKAEVVNYKKDDIFFFYSDGVTEAENGTGESFGPERVADLVAGGAHLGPDALIERVRSAVIEFTGRTVFDDDFTCLAVRID
jgi:sigma-B regulation protein RsbU (phosphoserine phosphatase)